MNNKENQIRTTTAEVSIVALSIFITLSIGIIVLLVTQYGFQFGYNAASVASGNLLFGVSLFLFSLEFFVVAIFYPRHVAYFGFIGSSLYGMGLMSMIVGISVALKSVGMDIVSYLFLTWMLIGYIIYYIVRSLKLGIEKPRGLRITIRIICFCILGSGYLLLTTIGG